MGYLIRFVLVLVLLVAAAGAGGLYVLHRYGRNLPEHQQLAAYEPPVVTRVHAGDGRLMAEFSREKRVFVPIAAIPRRVIDAFLSAEDKNFYRHPGIDVMGIARAAIRNVVNAADNRRLQGASTITQQVAKNFLLTNEVSIERKIKEAILAVRIERALSKDRILELYLNEIYLGRGSYGVAAAALNYFDRSLDELTVAQAAYLAALPKAPNNYDPDRDAAEAKARRDWVIQRMVEDKVLTPAEAAEAEAEPLVAVKATSVETVRADYAAEEIRRLLLARFGEDELYGGGYVVRATLDPRLQAIGEKALRDGMVAYDRRHGWRGPVAHLDLAEGDDWAAKLAEVKPPAGLAPWRLAVVLDLGKQDTGIGFADGTHGTIPFERLKWARPTAKDQTLGPAVGRPSDVLSVGDVVAVEQAVGEDGAAIPDTYTLRQIPDIGGGLVAMDPHTGRILAMVGGWSFQDSQFNRATQAMRQPGSSFKPFVYMAALDHGFTPSSTVEDAPIVIEQGPNLPKWKPENYTQEFYGLSTLRLGIEKSRNLMTIRVANRIGMEAVRDYARRFGIVDDLPLYLPMALGAGETTLLKMATGYAMMVNGGKRIQPSLIERIQDRYGRTVFRRDERVCEACADVAWAGQDQPAVPDLREQVVDPATAYQMVSMLQGVVERGTGAAIAELGRPLAGKTGTTDEYRDTWFVGFSPDLVVAVYLGFDTPRTLGKKETGSSVAVPVFKAFMAAALAGQPATPFRVPPGIRLVRVDAKTGLLPGAGTEKVIVEAFKPGTEPTTSQPAQGSEPSLSGVY